MKNIGQLALLTLRLSMANSRRKTLLAIGFMLAGEMSLPLIALSLRFFVVAALDRNHAMASVAAACVAVAWIVQLTFWHFGYRFYFDLLDLNMISLHQQFIGLVNGSSFIGHLERPSLADKFELLRGDTRALYWSFGVVVTGFGLVLQIGITGALLAWLAPSLLLVPVFAIPALIAGGRAERLVERERERTAQQRRLGRHLLELLASGAAAKEVRVFGLRDFLPGLSRTLWRQAGHELWRCESRAMALQIAGQVIFALAYIGALAFLVSRAITGLATVGDVLLAVALTGQVNQQLSRALGQVRSLRTMTRSVERYRWLRAKLASRQPASATSAKPPPRLIRGIELRNVSFSYPEAGGAPALSGVSVLFRAGSVVGLVGENGSGKTTLVKLLARLDDPDSGTILIDGVGLSLMEPAAWRQRISAGFQDFQRFEFVAREAVGVGDLPFIHDSATVTVALGKAGAQSLESSFPAGLETQLGNSYSSGHVPSTGQWQQVALGRAMMREGPLLLILDEPTASLDAQAEHMLFTRYAEQARRIAYAHGGITILVSHRFSTLQMADQIVVLKDGAIAEAGTHSTLMRGGLYADLYRLQQADYR